ncbi:MAG: type II toxin-antitoxin system Phd/YefM family antitoxin [Rectinemataceae bacterium]
MIVNTITEAKAHFSALMEKVQAGEEVIIKKGGTPIAVIHAYVQDVQERKPGALRGKITMAPDFDDLPEDIARSLGMED